MLISGCVQASPEYILSSNRYYKVFNTDPKPFGVAQYKCRYQEEAQLPALKSRSEVEAVKMLIGSNQNELYIGIQLPPTMKSSDFCENSACDSIGFLWTDGSKFKFDPNVAESVVMDENAWCFLYNFDKKQIKGLKAEDCRDTTLNYLCQSSCSVPCETPDTISNAAIKNMKPEADFYRTEHVLK